MITHEEAKELLDGIYVHTNFETKDKLEKYITQQEQLTKDIARYFELQEMWNLGNVFSKKNEWTKKLDDEYNALRKKLMGVK